MTATRKKHSDTPTATSLDESDGLLVPPISALARLGLTEEEWERRKQEVIRMLQEWIEEDDGGEQRRTWKKLSRALDEDRQGQRKLFP